MGPLFSFTAVFASAVLGQWNRAWRITIALCVPPNSSTIFRTHETRVRLNLPTQTLMTRSGDLRVEERCLTFAWGG